MHYPVTQWPTPAPDPDADALAEIAELMAQPAPGAWAAQGRCRDTDPELHQPTGAEDSIGYRRQARAAKAVCRSCPVLAECRDWAMATDETGIWGATTPAQRRRERARREQRRQRTTTHPTETPAAVLRPAS
ncbi:MAG: WhiB family transcriptional regulator [Actinomycetes bacterium]